MVPGPNLCSGTNPGKKAMFRLVPMPGHRARAPSLNEAVSPISNRTKNSVRRIDSAVTGQIYCDFLKFWGRWNYIRPY